MEKNKPISGTMLDKDFSLPLKLCPFCKGKAEMNQGKKHDIWWVNCTDCGVETAGHPTEDEAACAWNRRAD